MALAGMLITGEDIPVAYDRFRHRVMFPISDLKGRVIAFGGRALDADAPAKYLNSPETPALPQGRTSCSMPPMPAVPPSTKAQVIVVEGYMDVIALSEAGFPQTVAPLGTALTERPDPAAVAHGARAGAVLRRRRGRPPRRLPRGRDRAAAPEARLQRCSLPSCPTGLDPDDLIGQHGATALQPRCSTATRPLFDVLIEREERRGANGDAGTARLLRRTAAKPWSARIADRGVREHYDRELRETLWARTTQARARRSPAHDGRRAARPRRPAPRQYRSSTGGWPRGPPSARAWAACRGQPPAVQPRSRSNELARAQPAAAPPAEALLVMALLNHPWLLEQRCEEVAQLLPDRETLGQPARWTVGAARSGYTS